MKLEEALTITKMNLPTSSKKFKKIDWNDAKSNHELYARLKDRTDASRKQIIEKIIKAIDAIDFITDGPYVIKFTKSEFYLSVFVKKSESYIQIKTILAYNMRLRENDRVLTINEAEELFNYDLSEFYKDEFVNSYYGNMLIEESLDRNKLEVFIDFQEGDIEDRVVRVKF